MSSAVAHPADKTIPLIVFVMGSMGWFGLPDLFFRILEDGQVIELMKRYEQVVKDKGIILPEGTILHFEFMQKPIKSSTNLTIASLGIQG